MIRIFGALLLVSLPKLVGQTPSVTNVLNAASGTARLSPGAGASVHYTPHNPADNRLTVSVRVGEWPAFVVSLREGVIDVLLPMQLPLGPSPLVITTSLGSSTPFTVTLETHSPFLGNPRPVCPQRTTDVTLGAVGLGATNPLSPAGEAGAPTVAPTVSKPSVTVGGQNAEVLESILYPGSLGNYGVKIRLPSGLPEGPQPIVLTIGGQISNTATLYAGTVNALSTNINPLEHGRAAPEAIVSAYGCANPLADGHFIADSRSPATELGGTTVRVRDSNGVERPAPLYYAGPAQVNYVVPSGTALGHATVTITSASGAISKAPLDVQTVTPGFFPASLLVRVRDGVQMTEPAARPDRNNWGMPLPIDPGPETDHLYLVLFGTGLRGYSSLGSITATVGRVAVPVEYVGPQSEYPGLDQVNLKLLRSVAADCLDAWDVQLWVDGQVVSAGYLLLNCIKSDLGT